jgi:lariat debranching enzyme
MVVFAVEGCCHGELDNIYASVEQLAAVHGTKIDVLLICGDFQAVRNEADLATMACPVKYRDIRTFYKYYSGELVAPVLTIFVGGNHEASNHNWELYHGGWVAPNIYFLGYAGVVNVGGVRIAGSSGIFNGRHYQMGHYEKPPFDDDAVRSAYHVRELEVRRRLQLEPCTGSIPVHGAPRPRLPQRDPDPHHWPLTPTTGPDQVLRLLQLRQPVDLVLSHD